MYFLKEQNACFKRAILKMHCLKKYFLREQFRESKFENVF